MNASSLDRFCVFSTTFRISGDSFCLFFKINLNEQEGFPEAKSILKSMFTYLYLSSTSAIKIVSKSDSPTNGF